MILGHDNLPLTSRDKGYNILSFSPSLSLELYIELYNVYACEIP